jgi:TatD DNase family protein
VIEVLIDVHSHIYRMESDFDMEWSIQRAKDADISIINCCHNSSNPYEVEKTIELAEKHDNVFAALGLYYFGGERLEKLKMSVNEEVVKMAMDTIRSKTQGDQEIVAIGEVGLDYGLAKGSSERETQRKRFEGFVDLSGELDLPLIVHTSSEAVGDAIQILKEKQRPAVLHGFRGTLEQAKDAISRGCLIAIWPTIIYSKYLQKLVSELPLESLAFETDSPLPFHAPVPGVSINEPVNIVLTANKVAEIKGVAVEEVEEVTTRSAEQLFKLEN